MALSITTIVFTIVPERYFSNYKLLPNVSIEVNTITNRLLTILIIFLLSLLAIFLHMKLRKRIRIKRNNYSIQIEYGNLFKMASCKKVIPFDECFTISVGDAPSDINPISICGQYLTQHPMTDTDIRNLIDKSKLKPAKTKSKFRGSIRYDSGSLIPNEDFLLMAFTKLDKDGLGRMSREEYIDCLSLLWEGIDKYHGQKDVCIPILGSGVTRFEDESLTQQELLGIMIESYFLSTHKLKLPTQLHIVCKKSKDFSLYDVYKGEYF